VASRPEPIEVAGLAVGGRGFQRAFRRGSAEHRARRRDLPEVTSAAPGGPLATARYRPASVAAGSAGPVAEKREVDAAVGVSLVGPHRARGTERAPRLQADAREGGTPTDSDPRSATQLRDAPAASRRADYLREPAARTRGRLDHAAGVRALPAGRDARDVDRLDDAAPAHPNASQAHPETSAPDDVIVAKSFVVNGEPRFHQLEPARALGAGR